MENELLKIKEEALAKLADCSSLKELNEIRVLYLGKKGPIQEAMKSMKDMAVSYTHLDVYKRQSIRSTPRIQRVI